jgi:hypothetical protein
MTSAEIQTLLTVHQATRPDHLKALAPDAPKHLRDAFVAWRDHRDHLRTQLGMALSEEQSRWHDQDGNPVVPIFWKYGHSNIHNMKSMQEKNQSNAKTKAEQMREYHERRKAGLAKQCGRPRVENPTKDAIRCRENRAKKRESAA